MRREFPWHLVNVVINRMGRNGLMWAGAVLLFGALTSDDAGLEVSLHLWNQGAPGLLPSPAPRVPCWAGSHDLGADPGDGASQSLPVGMLAEAGAALRARASFDKILLMEISQQVVVYFKRVL